MILIGLGSNVEGPWGKPADTIRTAIELLSGDKTQVIKSSRLMLTKPMGPIDQPDYVNAAVIITTGLDPEQLMRHLHDIELQADRRRSIRWGPRTLDLDLLDYDGRICAGDGAGRGHQKPLVLPHPGIAEREFVLGPIAEIAPDWQHPVTAKTAAQMLSALGVNADSFVFVQ